MKKWFLVLALVMPLCFISCENETLNNVGEERIIAVNDFWSYGDTEGVSILFKNETMSGYSRFWENGKIVNHDASFATIGKINSLLKVNYVPMDGWQKEIDIKVGNGYVVMFPTTYYGTGGGYGRIFIKEHIDKGEASGYRIQIQYPWNPLIE